ncbi:radical SAM protein [Roseovarius salis]|uniref:radical SAM protein n=1 Tax=Roseovarius salis TaxID=3376063 RepID=UPI0037C9ADBC
MDCRVLRNLMLKSNGRLGCDDSDGYSIDLADIPPRRKWSARAAFNQPVYAHVRRSFANGVIPWPGTCETCDLYAPGKRVSDTLDHTVTIQVEPTLACSLRCPSCLRGTEIRRRAADTFYLDPDVFRQCLSGLAKDGISVTEIQYIGWGEPLDHPDFADLVRTARAIHPQAEQLVHTNGNFDFASVVADAPLDAVVVSADGATPASYPKYRRGGDWTTVLTFIRDAKAQRPDIRLEWKYILFDFNDSVEETDHAQRLADDLGVDSLLFVMTNSKKRSERYTAKTFQEFPLKSPRAMISPAAALQRKTREAGITYPQGRARHISDGMIFVDRAFWTNAGLLEIEGWAVTAAQHPARDLACSIDGGPTFRPGRALTRSDVVEVFPTVQDPDCGFRFRIPVNSPAEQMRVTLFQKPPTGEDYGPSVDVVLTPTDQPES